MLSRRRHHARSGPLGGHPAETARISPVALALPAPVERSRRPGRLPLLMATALREGLEEMRLNPLGVEFMGLLPTQDLVLFNRRIYPLVGRIRWQRRFYPNWEVEKIVPIPLRHLLNARRYAQYRLTIDIPRPERSEPEIKRLPSFIHRYPNGEKEIFWGATLRIALEFLQIVYAFSPPATEDLPAVPGRLTPAYLTGNRA